MASGCGDDSESHKKKVLCVGNICLDFVNVAREYPEEDSDQRGLDYYWQRGGNASNSCTVLSILSVPCECLGVMGSHGTEASWIQADFAQCGIETSHCLMKPVQPSVSTVVISQATGSRTIFHYPRDRPELTYKEFQEIFHGDFTQYSWIHFEAGRSVDYVSHMIDDVVAFNNKHSLTQAPDGQRLSVVISVEIEKPELNNPESVMDKADIVFISKDVAKCKGFSNAVMAVEGLYHFCKDDAVLICAWGDSGAAARYRDITLTAPALADIKVVDTLGAGDTFVAGFISSLWKHGWKSTDSASRDTDSASRDTDSASRDADSASRDTDSASRDADSASRDTDSASRDADSASRDADSASRDADSASRDADSASRDADSASRDADSASRDADSASRDADSASIDTDRASRDTDSASRDADNASRDTDSASKDADNASRETGSITRDADSTSRDIDTSIITNALQYACHLAGLKCTIFGYQGLKQLVSCSV